MSSDFAATVDRRNTCCFKWDILKQRYGRDDLLPFWIADTEFVTCPEVHKAIRARAEHGLFGYTFRPEEYNSAIISWFAARHGWQIQHDWITSSPGVVPALSICIECFTNPGDAVIVLSPAYPPFFEKIEQNRRRLVVCDLVPNDDRYEIDFDEFEKAVIREKCHLFILCNPHNPTGRVWTEDELRKLGNICINHNVRIVSDDIHCDIVFSGNRYTPIASLSDELAENTITCTSPGKTFNLTGLASSVIIIPDKIARQSFNGVLSRFELADGNLFGITAVKAAYSTDGKWVDDLVKHLETNRDYMLGYLSKAGLPITAVSPEGTFLMLLDMRGLNLEKEQLAHRLIYDAGLVVNAGYTFGKNCEGFVRFNFACTRNMLEKGLNRLQRLT